jgi:hypothetical protein
MSTATSPFKFLDSYTQQDKEIFFGREKETEALYEALSGVKHLLVYGPSGAGKTSLIECGLRNQFSDADWYALTIRKGARISTSVFASINEKLKSKIDLDPGTQLPSDPDWDFGQAIERLFSERFQPIYLLFDQFEELLISGTEEEKRDFFIRLNRLIRYKIPCRMMLIMREEFIGHLSEFEPLCPSIFQHRFRLEKMRRGDVREVIQKTFEAPQYTSFFKVNQSELLTDKILSKLPDERREIELTHVQVFLAELFDRANEVAGDDAQPILDRGLIETNDNLEGVLDKFLKNQLQELNKDFGKDKAMEVLSLLISDRHTKLQVTSSVLEQELQAKSVKLDKQLAQLLNDLQQRRILRTLKAGDQIQYEISHDVLALVVGQNLTEEIKLREKAADAYRVYDERKGLFSQEDLDYLRPFGAYLAYPSELEERMRASEDAIATRQHAELIHTRRQLQRVLVLLAAAVLALVGAGYFWWEANDKTKEAERAKVEAVEANKATISALNTAKQNLQTALQEKQSRLGVELSAAKRSLETFERAAHIGAIDNIHRRIDSLEMEKSCIEIEIKNAL